MSINKTLLKKIAAKAWTECYNNMGWSKNYVVTIQGDSDQIFKILDEFADEMNSRDCNRDYTVNVGALPDNKFEFFYCENERETACYEFDEDEEEEEIVAESAVFQCDENPAPDDKIWCKIRDHLLTPNDGDFFAHDDLALALNYGNCLHAGRHEKTSDDDWKLFLEMTNLGIGYSQDYCYEIYKRLDSERLLLFVNGN